MAIVRETLQAGQKPTKEQIGEIRNAAKHPIVYDEGSPKLTSEELAEFRRVSEINAAERERVMCSIRLQKRTLDWWKSLGEGYTAVMARLLDEARNHPDLIKKCL
jgi:uncharacterized protein (DUF4415 family)